MQQKCRKLWFWLCQFRQIPEQLPPDASMLDVQQRIKCFSRRGGAACATEIGKQSDCELIASSLALENPIMCVSEQTELRYVNRSFCGRELQTALGSERCQLSGAIDTEIDNPESSLNHC